jgi:tRNA (guanine-N7-)-methyltransferase
VTEQQLTAGPGRHPVHTYKARRRTSPSQAAAIAALMPAHGLPVDGRRLDLREVFGRSAPVVLEIGFGRGEATARMAAADPGRDLLAVDVHTPGVGLLLRQAADLGLRNVRVAEGDALVVLRDMLAPGSLDEVRVFFPDPWPKGRHAKRRLVTGPFAALVADRLAPAGRLHVATDWAAYAVQVRGVLAGSPAYDVVVDGPRPPHRPVTRFEQQGLDAGRDAHDVVAVRRG